MKLSIVATLYRSAPYVQEFHSRATASARHVVGDDYEIILVNDGSPDSSLVEATRLTQRDPHLVVVDLSRNFGHHKAMMTGLAHAQGERVFLIDSDLEEEPEWLIPFTSHMDTEGCDVVFGTQTSRKGGLIERASGPLYYLTFRLLTGIRHPKNIATARLMARSYVDALLLHQERELNIGGLYIVTGFDQRAYPIIKHSSSPTTYSLSRKFGHLVNAVTSFSSLPLVFTFYSGLLISTSALAYISHLIYRYLFGSAPPDGYTSTIASIWLFSGLIIFFLGIQGIYIAKVFSEVKQRPYTIVRRIYRHPGQ
jgi:putative glycosyltransferase